MMALQLPQDRRIGDLVICGEEEGFTENDAERAVPFERQKHLFTRLVDLCLGRNDAKVFSLRRNQDVAAAEVDQVAVPLAPDF
jgi:hypothetical protein